MRVVKKLLYPSRPDAVRLRRTEKGAMLYLFHAVTTLDDLKKDLPDRLDMIQDGHERLNLIVAEADELLNDIRVTIPENQRRGLENVASDYQARLVPCATPGETNIVITYEEFRTLVDCARVACRDCTFDDNECEKCELYQLLTSILPMDDYHCMNLCPYNLGVWKN